MKHGVDRCGKCLEQVVHIRDANGRYLDVTTNLDGTPHDCDTT